jgi:hypothetical protein
MAKTDKRLFDASTWLRASLFAIPSRRESPVESESPES